MYTNMPYLVEGEIIQVQASPEAEKTNVVRYICLVELPDGSQSIIPNVMASTMFGGIDDYFQVRSRGSKDGGNSFQPSAVDGNNDARIGDRVYIAFISGNLTKPIIIGYAQHPNQTQEFKKPEGLLPQAVLKYLGVRFDITKDGVFKITHYGAPVVKYVETGGASSAKAAITGAISSLGADDSAIEADKTNTAVTPASSEKRTQVEFHDLGGLSIRDSLDQLIDINTELGRIYIANNDVQSGPQIETNNTDSEYVLLDRDKELVLINARSTIQLYSFGNRKDVTEGNHTHKIGGDEEITIDGDKKDIIKGDLDESVTGDVKRVVSGSLTVEVDGDIAETIKGAKSLESTGAFTIQSPDSFKATVGSATLSMAPGKISFGVGPTEVLKTLSDTIQGISDACTAIVALTVPTSMGPSGPPINGPDFTKVLTTLTALKSKLDAITG